MLYKNVVIIPVKNFRRQLESREDSDVLPESNTRSTQKNLPVLASYNLVKSRSDVEVDSSEINFTEVASLQWKLINAIQVTVEIHLLTLFICVKIMSTSLVVQIPEIGAS